MNLGAADKDAQLAVELAMQLAPTSDILQRHNLTISDLRFKLTNPAFMNMFNEAKRVWNSDLSAEERIKVKARMLVEDSLLQVYGILHSADSGVQPRLDAFKSLAKVAGVDQQGKSGDSPGSKVSITFNIGNGVAPMMIEGTVVEQTSEEIAYEEGD